MAHICINKTVKTFSISFSFYFNSININSWIVYATSAQTFWPQSSTRHDIPKDVCISRNYTRSEWMSFIVKILVKNHIHTSVKYDLILHNQMEMFAVFHFTTMWYLFSCTLKWQPDQSKIKRRCEIRNEQKIGIAMNVFHFVWQWLYFSKCHFDWFYGMTWCAILFIMFVCSHAFIYSYIYSEDWSIVNTFETFHFLFNFLEYHKFIYNKCNLSLQFISNTFPATLIKTLTSSQDKILYSNFILGNIFSDMRTRIQAVNQINKTIRRSKNFSSFICVAYPSMVSTETNTRFKFTQRPYAEN